MKKRLIFRDFAEHLKKTKGYPLTAVASAASTDGRSRPELIVKYTAPYVSEEDVANVKRNIQLSDKERRWLDNIGIASRSYSPIQRYLQSSPSTQRFLIEKTSRFSENRTVRLTKTELLDLEIPKSLSKYKVDILTIFNAVLDEVKTEFFRDYKNLSDKTKEVVSKKATAGLTAMKWVDKEAITFALDLKRLMYEYASMNSSESFPENFYVVLRKEPYKLPRMGTDGPSPQFIRLISRVKIIFKFEK